MRVIWREDKLTDVEAKLLQACLDAHAQSALRQSISSVAVVNSAEGSKDLGKAIMCALASIGGTHAPLMETWQFLFYLNDHHLFVRMEALQLSGDRIPGWGNSFEKDRPDSFWVGVETILADSFLDVYGKLGYVTDALHKAGKQIYPNPSAYTAAVAIALKMPPEILEWLFIAGRLNVWTMLFLNQVKKGKV